MLMIAMLTGVAGAVSNTYTQSGSLALPTVTSFSTNNVYDSSKITAMNISVTPTYTHVDPENITGCVAHWKFDDNTGTTVANSVNASNQGTMVGNITWGTGKYNSCGLLNYNGTTDGRVEVTDPIAGQTAFTYTCWVNAAWTRYGGIYADYASSYKNTMIFLYDNNAVRFYVGDGANLSSACENTHWTNNTWHMITCTFNSTSGQMATWVDLNKATQPTTITKIGSTPATGTWDAIGRYQNQYSTTTGFLNGSEDDVVFYNRSLTDAEIQSLYYSKFSGVTVKSNADASSVTVSDNGGNVNIPYSAGDSSVTSINATVPTSVTISGVTINDYTHTAPPINYALTVVSSQEYQSVSSFSASVLSGTRPLTVQFTDTSTNYPTSWNWNFGDGQTSNSPNPTHTFTSAGTYNVTMTSSNGQGSGGVAYKYVVVNPQAGDTGVLNNGKRVAIYVEGTSGILHDMGFGSMLHEYNISYYTNATIGSITPANTDLLITGRCTNYTANIINNYISNGGHVWFTEDPLNDSDTYMLDESNSTYGLPSTRFYCLGSLNQVNITAGQSLNVNTTDPATSFMTSPQTSLSTVYVWTNSRNFGSTYGVNSYGYTYNELVYSSSNACQLAEIWNNSTGARIVYSNFGDFISGNEFNYFNSTCGATMFNNVKRWVLGLDSNNMQVSLTYPKGDKQFVCTFDDSQLAASELGSGYTYFWNRIHGMPNNIGVTMFIIPAGRQSGTVPGVMSQVYNYEVGNGADLNTIHPHQNDINNPQPASVDWYNNTASVPDMQSALSLYLQNYSIGVNNDPNMKFYSIRYPQTKTNTNSSQAAANLGFKIASDYGSGTTMGYVDYWPYYDLNTVWLQKQQLINNYKTQVIEMEAASVYDLTAAANYDPAYYANNSFLGPYGPSNWTLSCEAVIPTFLNVNFPGVYTLGAHYQCTMQTANWTNALCNTLWYLDNQTSYCAYANYSTLAQYEIAIQDSNIRVDTVGTTTTATVTAKEPINAFTLKLMNINNGVKAYLDGIELTADHVIYEDGVYYVFADIPSGTHTLVVKDEASASGAIYIGKNGVASPVLANGNWVKNNAATSHSATVTGCVPYTNCVNAISASSNTVYLGAHNLSTALPATFTPKGGNVNVTVYSWNNTYKCWNESSATHSASMLHTISGLTPGQSVAVVVDNATATEMTADASGTISFNYTGGYSDHQFVVTSETPEQLSTTISPISTNSVDQLQTVNVSVTGAIVTDTSLLGRVKSLITSGYAFAGLLIIVLGAVVVLRQLNWM